MFCTQCGKKNEELARFCFACGAELSAVLDGQPTTSASAPRTVTAPDQNPPRTAPSSPAEPSSTRAAVQRCPSCGRPNHATATRCSSCGLRFVSGEHASELTASGVPG